MPRSWAERGLIAFSLALLLTAVELGIADHAQRCAHPEPRLSIEIPEIKK